ncbi:DUF4232 domain-containing protein [Streptomyces sp. UH6]|uniref:DUF4232 domain-containing protein n=1 Tax=Streptomyces sp. UH6 TaxID=2748379 RepID=UPI0015D4B2F1|nr:DUF4232 domain-containing protein [Streptomyces sp. UH6]NYV77324.1 DUF4232 domain-containing protein [Streptomyces sp. UH6]
MRVLASRRPRVRLLAAATVAFAAFSLTACQGDADADVTDSSPQASAPAAGSDASDAGKGAKPAGSEKSDDAASDAEKGTGSSTGSGGSQGTGKGGSAGTSGSDSGSGSGSGSGSDASPVPCTAANTKVRVTAVSRPINHILVTATNTGTVPCFAYHAPFLRFDDAQAPVPVLRDSRPQAVVTIDPGKSAYAGVMTAAATGEGEGGRTAQKLTVTYADRSGAAAGRGATVALPSGGVYVDSTHTVTYWQQEMDLALVW